MSNTGKRLNRLERLEQKAPVERKFFGWAGNPWTPEQMAEAIRREPECLFFWRSLLDEPTCRLAAELRRQEEGRGSAEVH